MRSVLNKQRGRSRLLPWILLSSLLVPACGERPVEAQAGSSDPAAEPVLAMNRAASEKKLEAVLATFAEPSLQLRPPHSEGQAVQLASDLHAYWKSFAPLLFQMAKTYERRCKVEAVHRSEDIAQVWARIETRSLMPGQGEPIARSFTECYQLRKIDGDWKILTVLNTRKTQ